MKVELSPSFTDDDQNNLKILLEAFGSAVSLEDIASSYCETGRNLDSTAELLCNMQGSISEKQDQRNTDEEASSESSSAILSEKINIVKPRSKKCSASIGTVSNVIGRGYMNPRNQPKRFIEKSKPMKISSNDFPVTEIWGEEKEPGITNQCEPMDNDLVEFLYKMLGNGFELGMDVIQEVIGQCGYDMPMIIDKLVDMSAATLGKTDAVIGTAATTDMKNIYDVGSTSCAKQSQPLHCTKSGGDDLILPRAEMKKKDTQREVLEALFSAPDRIQDHQVSTGGVRICKQSPYGRIVAKPLKEMIVEDFTFINRKPINDTDTEAHEESYDELRKAVNENFVTMREYYKASGDAYSKNEFKAAQSLLEQGNFYMEKAKEAHEKSCQKLVADSNKDEDFHINVHYLEPKDALHHMRLHLKSLCGLPSVRFMKVVVGINGDKTDVRRKRLITKLLEKEGIPWTEEGNGWTISVQVEEIDQNKLSFANNELSSAF